METDVDRILALAGQGGTYYPVSENNNYKIVEIKIGTPHIAYVQTWIFEDNTNSQLLVPALIFPIINIPDEVQYFYKENVVVPLAKDIVSQRAELYQK